MTVQHVLATTRQLSSRQRRVRQRARRLCFEAAVCYSADAWFGFTHRASAGKSLWSDKEHVWLGNTTFLCWALDSGQIDIPRIVAGTDGAPEDETELHEAVKSVLAAYWAECLASLPRKSTPRWLPLP